ncbi:MAG: hypothetical protein E7527_03405 [Ruminococcaceae bacterium]|nr:hypothetical protein [Oscillospiraceae bacterium]
MKRSLYRWQVGGFLFTALGGVLLHFLYDWTGQNPAVGLFSAVNESIWEHMKLLYVPLLVFSLIEAHFLSKEYPAFWCAKLWGTSAGLVTIPLLYYTYTGALGFSADWFNIFIYFLAAAVPFSLETHLLRHHLPCRNPKGAVAALLALGVLFALFTFFTPHFPLFQDPLTGTYGI